MCLLCEYTAKGSTGDTEMKILFSFHGVYNLITVGCYSVPNYWGFIHILGFGFCFHPCDLLMSTPSCSSPSSKRKATTDWQKSRVFQRAAFDFSSESSWIGFNSEGSWAHSNPTEIEFQGWPRSPNGKLKVITQTQGVYSRWFLRNSKFEKPCHDRCETAWVWKSWEQVRSANICPIRVASFQLSVGTFEIK